MTEDQHFDLLRESSTKYCSAFLRADRRTTGSGMVTKVHIASHSDMTFVQLGESSGSQVGFNVLIMSGSGRIRRAATLSTGRSCFPSSTIRRVSRKSVSK